MLIGFNFLIKNKPKIKKHKASTIVGKIHKKSYFSFDQRMLIKI